MLKLKKEVNPVMIEKSELKAFDDSKLGVKGLLDAGIIKIPQIFINKEQHMLDISSDPYSSLLSIPIIDLENIVKEAVVRVEIINKIGDACEKWGFFHVINPGIPKRVLSEMIDGISVWLFNPIMGLYVAIIF